MVRDPHRAAYVALYAALLLSHTTHTEAATDLDVRRCVPLNGTQTVERLGALPPHLVNAITQHPGIFDRSFGNRGEGEHGHVIFQGLNTNKTQGAELARKLVSEATCMAQDQFQIVSVRILWNNHGTPAQAWHIDYGTSGLNTFGLLVALTLAWLNNTTEYKLFRPEDHAAILRDMRGGQT